jgi:hypothetical protein
LAGAAFAPLGFVAGALEDAAGASGAAAFAARDEPAISAVAPTPTLAATIHRITFISFLQFATSIPAAASIIETVRSPGSEAVRHVPE